MDNCLITRKLLDETVEYSTFNGFSHRHLGPGYLFSSILSIKSRKKKNPGPKCQWF